MPFALQANNRKTQWRLVEFLSQMFFINEQGTNMSQQLITAEQIKNRIAELGKEITKQYHKEDIILVCILNGSFMFCADLARAIDLEMDIDFMALSSYGDAMVSSGNVRVDLDLRKSIKDKNILIVEDIVDTGRTIAKLLELLQTRNPKTLKVCTLLSKPSRREIPVQIDFVGFTIEDRFVIGYGLDYQGKKRNLPYIGVKG